MTWAYKYDSFIRRKDTTSYDMLLKIVINFITVNLENKVGNL